MQAVSLNNFPLEPSFPGFYLWPFTNEFFQYFLQQQYENKDITKFNQQYQQISPLQFPVLPVAPSQISKEPLTDYNGAVRPRRTRKAFAPHQIVELEKEFDKDMYPSRCLRNEIAQRLNLCFSQVQIWFQNRRAKKRKSLHGSRKKLKKCCDFIEHVKESNEITVKQLFGSSDQPFSSDQTLDISKQGVLNLRIKNWLEPN